MPNNDTKKLGETTGTYTGPIGTGTTNVGNFATSAGAPSNLVGVNGYYSLDKASLKLYKKHKNEWQLDLELPAKLQELLSFNSDKDIQSFVVVDGTSPTKKSFQITLDDNTTLTTAEIELGASIADVQTAISDGTISLRFDQVGGRATASQIPLDVVYDDDLEPIATSGLASDVQTDRGDDVNVIFNQVFDAIEIQSGNQTKFEALFNGGNTSQIFTKKSPASKDFEWANGSDLFLNDGIYGKIISIPANAWTADGDNFSQTISHTLNNENIVWQIVDSNGNKREPGFTIINGTSVKLTVVAEGAKFGGTLKIVGVDNPAGLATVATTGDYDDLLNKPTTITVLQAAQIETNKTNIASNDTDISALQGLVSTNTSNIASATTARGTLSDRITVEEGKSVTFTTKIGDLETEVGDNTSDISGNTTNITTQTGKVSVLEGQRTSDKVLIDDNKDDITSLTTRVTNAENNISSNDTDIADIIIDVASNATKGADNATTISATNTAVGLLDARVVTNKNKGSDNQNQINEVRNKLNLFPTLKNADAGKAVVVNNDGSTYEYKTVEGISSIFTINEMAPDSDGNIDLTLITPGQAAAIVTNSNKAGVTAEQASEIAANTLKVGVTQTLLDIVGLNTAKTGITPTQAQAIISNTAKSGIEPSQTAAILVNSAKVGISTTQVQNILLNNAKVGITPLQASNILANNLKVGITTDQANKIEENFLKEGVTVEEKAQIAVNTGKVGISSAQTAHIALNNDKVGITPGQAAAIVTNTAKTGISASQSTAIAHNTSVVNKIPNPSVADSGKVIKVDSSGDYELTNDPQDNADWTETDTTKPGYIKDKPTTISATQTANITTNNAKLTYPAADKTKVGHLTVTETINLDDIETAVEANTAKVGLTTDQVTAIINNTAKVGLTTIQAAAIAANSLKTGITTEQANHIVTNNMKTSFNQPASDKVAKFPVAQSSDQGRILVLGADANYYLDLRNEGELNETIDWNAMDPSLKDYIQHQPKVLVNIEEINDDPENPVLRLSYNDRGVITKTDISGGGGSGTVEVNEVVVENPDFRDTTSVIWTVTNNNEVRASAGGGTATQSNFDEEITAEETYIRNRPQPVGIGMDFTTGQLQRHTYGAGDTIKLNDYKLVYSLTPGAVLSIENNDLIIAEII